MIYVISPPRHGSSAVAGVLHHLGVDMGNIKHQADPRNPAGYFEDWDFRRLNIKLIPSQVRPDHRKQHEHAEQAIKDRIAERSRLPLAGLKDPLLCLLGDIYLQADPAPVLIFPQRQLRRAAASYLKMPVRLTTLEEAATVLTVFLKARALLRERFSEIPLLDVYYDSLCSRPEDAVADIARFIGVPATSAAVAFIEPKFNRIRL